MGEKRKLQGEIDRVFKRVSEGVEEFEAIWDKMHTATNPTQKEKFEGDLKKEIKKLQRLRDQIKTWQASNDIKDKSELNKNRKLIETQMERFKVVEREMKTKTFSKEGLSMAAKLDPNERAKSEVRDWINSCTERLGLQVDQFEAEIEVLRSKKKCTKKEEERLHKLDESIERHREHERKLEFLLRVLDNDSVEPSQVKALEDDLEYYIDTNQEPDFEENEFMYDDLGVDFDATEEEMEDDEEGGATRKRSESMSSVSSKDESKGDDTKKEKKRNSKPDEEAANAVKVAEAAKKTAAAAKPVAVPAAKAAPAPIAAAGRTMSGSVGATAAPAAPAAQRSTSIPTARPIPLPTPTPSPVPVAVPATTPTVRPPAPTTQPIRPTAPTAAAATRPTVPPPSAPAPTQPQAGAPRPGPLLSSVAQALRGPAPTQQPAQAPPTQAPPATAAIQPSQGPSTPQPSTPAPAQPTPTPPAPAGGFAAKVAATAPSQPVRPPAAPQPATQAPAPQPTPTPPPPEPTPPIQAPTVPAPATQPPAKAVPRPASPQPQQVVPGSPQSSGPQQVGVPQGYPTQPGMFAADTQQQRGSLPADVYPNVQQALMQPQLQPQPEDSRPNGFNADIQSSQLASMDPTLQALYHSVRHIPEPTDSDRERTYSPRNPAPTPAWFPLHPVKVFDSPGLYEKMDLDTLFFIFYYNPGTYQQYLAARELKRQSWRFHKKYLTWFQRHEEPKIIMDDYEQGTYVYFDYETGWCQRKKTDFKFEYQYLENQDLTV